MATAIQRRVKARQTILNNTSKPNSVARNGVTHPLLVYFGGKWLLAPWVVENLPPHHCYVELFGGAASVLMSKPKARVEFLNDLNDEVYNLYLVMRDKAMFQRLYRMLRRTPYHRTEFLAAYKRTDDPVELARRMLVRSGMGFHPKAIQRISANFRESARRPAASTFRNQVANLVRVRRRLDSVHIENLPALKLLSRLDTEQTLFYVDPPYVAKTRSSDTRYVCEMTDRDHIELLEALNAARGMVVLSGYPSALYEQRLKGWQMLTRSHRVFCTNGAGRRTEALWLNPQAVRALGAASNPA